MAPEQREKMVKILGCAALLAGTACLIQEPNKKSKKRRWWVKPINQNRPQQGHYKNLLHEMRLTDHEMFFNYTRMTPNVFDDLLRLVGPFLKKSSQRESVSPGERLTITLRLAFQVNAFTLSINYLLVQGESMKRDVSGAREK